MREKHGQEHLLWFPWEGMSKAGSQANQFRINNFSRLWGIETVLSCVTPGPLVIRQCVTCKSLLKVIRGMGSGLDALYMKVTLAG